MTDATTMLMQEIAREIDEALNGSDRPRRNGFVLLTFPFEAKAGARANYVSNGRRGDVLIALKEIVARFEGQPDVRGRA